MEMVKYAIFLSLLFFVSELLLLVVTFRKKQKAKMRADRGSILLFWFAITGGLTLGFFFARYGNWPLLNRIAAFVGYLFILSGAAIRWLAIIRLKRAFSVNVSIYNGQQLQTGGIYRHVRHPAYSGLLMIMVGFALAMGTIISFIAIVSLILPGLLYRISVEERMLYREFGDRYASYASKTGKLIPGIF